MKKTQYWDLDYSNNNNSLVYVLLLDGIQHASIEFCKNTMGITAYHISEFKYDDLVTDDDKAYFLNMIIPRLSKSHDFISNIPLLSITHSNDKGMMFIENYLKNHIVVL